MIRKRYIMIKQLTGSLRSLNSKKVKKVYNKIIFICLVISVSSSSLIYSQDNARATEIIKMADEKFNGEKSGISTMVMTIVRPTWERRIEFKSWSMGRENSLTLIT